MANKYLKDRRDIYNKGFAAGFSAGLQVATDYMTITFRDPEVMSGKPLGRGKIERIIENSIKLDDHFCIAFSDHVEADYVQEEMDAILREVWEDDLIPFRERHPYAAQYGYAKARKGWVE